MTSRPRQEGILVLDYGSQYTLLIARRLRELGVYTEVVDGTSRVPPNSFQASGLILSGGPDSVGENGARGLPSWVLALEVPILGICYGMQLLIHDAGGDVRQGKKREYGHAMIHLHADLDARLTQLFDNQPHHQRVWMSHGDDVHGLPAQFSAVCHTEDGVIAGIVHREKPIYGLQYHPEVHHTEFGAKLLEIFARKICNAPVNWRRSDMLQAAINAVRSDATGKKVLVACSGGVDSTVTAAICAQALGPENVSAVLCDHGFMRKNEVPWVVDSLLKAGLPRIEVLDRSKLFLDRLAGISDPEQKRKIIGRSFIEVFEDYAQHHTFSFLAQGTLYPDVIESAGHGAGAKVIKSHHNVGGLPETLKLPLLEPFRYLFKDEVRAVGEQLGLPAELVHRHPFPGPGLAIRIMGEVTKDRLELLREADNVFIGMLRAEGHYDKVWQAFAVLLPIKTVGVMGDNRTYQDTLALRAVSAIDAMTAEVGELPISFLSRAAGEIVKKCDGINRVVYDVTTKPPATIEWE